MPPHIHILTPRELTAASTVRLTALCATVLGSTDPDKLTDIVRLLIRREPGLAVEVFTLPADKVLPDAPLRTVALALGRLQKASPSVFGSDAVERRKADRVHDEFVQSLLTPARKSNT